MAQLRALLQYLGRQPAAAALAEPDPDAVELSRLMSAAVVSRSFREAFLRDPMRAIANGYDGERFHFSPALLARLSAIRARNLEEFARHLADLDREPIQAESLIPLHPHLAEHGA